MIDIRLFWNGADFANNVFFYLITILEAMDEVYDKCFVCGIFRE